MLKINLKQGQHGETKPSDLCGKSSNPGSGNVQTTPTRIIGHLLSRKNGNKVHICVRCDFPIAIYGRLDPCHHIFCLTCANEDPRCYLCDEGITRVVRHELLEGVYICGAARCLKSFTHKDDFELHIEEKHMELLVLEDQAPPAEIQSSSPQTKQVTTPGTIERQSRQQQFRSQKQQQEHQQQHQKHQGSSSGSWLQEAYHY